MKSVPKRTVILQIIEESKEVKYGIVADSLKECAVTITWDGNEDEKIPCSKEEALP